MCKDSLDHDVDATGECAHWAHDAVSARGECPCDECAARYQREHCARMQERWGHDPAVVPEDVLQFERHATGAWPGAHAV